MKDMNIEYTYAILKFNLCTVKWIDIKCMRDEFLNEVYICICTNICIYIYIPEFPHVSYPPR
jgi:hypothetical protein